MKWMVCTFMDKLKVLKASHKIQNNEVYGNMDLKIKSCMEKLESLDLLAELEDLYFIWHI